MYRIKTAEEMQSDFGIDWRKMFPEFNSSVESILGRKLSDAEVEDILYDYSFINGFHIGEQHIIMDG